MSARPPRRHIILAAAVVIAAIVIASSIFVSSYLATPRTVTNDITTTSTRTTTSLSTTTQLSTTTSVRTQTVVAETNYTITNVITSSISTVTQNETSTTTETVNNPIPWYGLVYLSALPGCMVSSGIVSYPCPASSRADPYVFDCAAAAATPQGCTEQVNITGTTNESFTITRGL